MALLIFYDILDYKAREADAIPVLMAVYFAGTEAKPQPLPAKLKFCKSSS